jgi:hypothetical protein
MRRGFGLLLLLACAPAPAQADGRGWIDANRARILTEARAGAAGDVVVARTLGGSPPLYLFHDILDAPAVTLSLANNQHAEDENLPLGNLWEAIAITAAGIGGD